MKKKRNRIFFILSVLVLSIIIVGMFSSFASPGREGHVKRDFTERNSILYAYHTGEMSYENAGKALSAIETGSLLKEDKECMAQNTNPGSESLTIPVVTDVCEITDSFKYRTYIIYVTAESIEDGVKYIADERYHVSAVRDGDKYLLCNIMLLDGQE